MSPQQLFLQLRVPVAAIMVQLTFWQDLLTLILLTELIT